MSRSRVGLALPALAICALFPAATAEAARQGTIGANSSGSITISASVAPKARVSGLGNFELSLADRAGAARASRQICLLSNARGIPYAISATGSGRNGAFELSNGSQTTSYAVAWSSPAQADASYPASGAAARANLRGASSDAECRSGAGAVSLTVALDARQLAAAETDSPHTGILMLTVSPQ